MVKYNPKDWFGLIFQFHRADTFRKLFWVMLSLAIFSGLIAYLQLRVSWFHFPSSTALHSLTGFIISLLLVFRTNTAYDRWWEGRKQWGALVNVSRNFALKLNAFIPKSEERRRSELADMTAVYATILKDHLRDVPEKEIKENLPSHVRQKREAYQHIPNSLAHQMQLGLMEIYQKGEISEAAYLALMQDLNKFTDICGACERIKKTPIPYTYNMFIKKFIFIYIISMPFAFVSTFGFYCIGVTVFTFYALASLEMIAEEIEDPFGLDSNDLPTTKLSKTISLNVKEIFRN